MAKGYAAPIWMTYKQAHELKGLIKGERTHFQYVCKRWRMDRFRRWLLSVRSGADWLKLISAFQEEL